MKDPLFEPIEINSMKCKNRIYMPAMHLNMTRDNTVTDQIVAFYEQRALGGAGLICAGFAIVDELGGNITNIGAHKDEYIEGLSRLADAIGKNGAHSVLQINHAGRYNHSMFLKGQSPVAPSAIASRLTREKPRQLEEDEIVAIIKCFADAAVRTKKAGFDAVEVLCGTGYLISEFLSQITNKREDSWGGSFENRMRFGLQVIKEIRKSVGPDYPLMVRMNGNDLMPGGISDEERKEFASRLVKEGVDCLCVNVGWHEARIPQIVSQVPRAAFAHLIRAIKEHVDVPVIGSHRINDPEIARELIADGICHMVAMGRSLISDPKLPEKALTGREKSIIHCVGCGQGCFDHIFEMTPIECLANPLAGHEEELQIEPAPKAKKVMIIGGGAAGMSAALAASDRGHLVDLYEKSHRLGGQLILAGTPPGRGEFKVLAKDLAYQVDIKNVNVHLGKVVDMALIEKENPDHIILATGAGPNKPSIKGIELPHVVQAWDVLTGKERTGQKVVVIGAGAVGVETALFLAEKGTVSGEILKFLLVQRAVKPDELYGLATRGTKEVSLVEMLPKIGADIGKTTRWVMLQDLKIASVKTRTNTQLLEITEKMVKLKKNHEVTEIEADTVVLATGANSINKLEDAIEEKQIPYTLVGDADDVTDAFDAMHEGFAAGREI